MNTTTVFCDTHSTLPPSPELSSDDSFPELSELVLRQIASLRADIPIPGIVADAAEKVEETVKDAAEDAIAKAAELVPDVIAQAVELVPDIFEPQVQKIVDTHIKDAINSLQPQVEEKVQEAIKKAAVIADAGVINALSCCFRRRATPSQK